MTRGKWQTCLCFAAALAVSEPAHAQSSVAEPGHNEPEALSTEGFDTAAVTFWEGKRLYDAGEIAQALTQFESAYATTKDPVLLYDIAQCQRQLGMCEIAKRDYREFAEQVVQNSLTQRAAKWISELERSCPDPPNLQTVAAPSRRTAGRAEPRQSEPRQSEPRIAIEVDHHPGVPVERDLSGQRHWQLSLVLLAASVASGATTAGIAIWNHNRHQAWESKNAALAKGNVAGESDLKWSVRQQENDQFGGSIEDTRKVTLALGAVSGAALIASAFSFFAFSGSRTRATAAQLNHRVIPNVTPGNYQVLVSGSF